MYVGVGLYLCIRLLLSNQEVFIVCWEIILRPLSKCVSVDNEKVMDKQIDYMALIGTTPLQYVYTRMFMCEHLLPVVCQCSCYMYMLLGVCIYTAQISV